MKKIYIGFAFAHHKNSQGGYHHIKEYLKYDTIIDAQWEKEFYESTSTNFFFRAIRRLYIMVLGQGTPLTLIRCILLAIIGKNQVFHFIYAENTYKWLHNFIGKSNKIVCTFHQPASFFQNHPEWIQTIKKIDAVILMTDQDVEQFMKWTGKNNVYFIPHGVNCSFYSFDNSIEKRNSILMVGNWLRDFAFAAIVFERVKSEMPEIEINVVINKQNFNYFKGLKVNLLSQITDIELKRLYQTSALVFFPLKQFTANNAVLEAASCGCEILISTPDIPDLSYFSNQYINFTSDNEEIVYREIYKAVLQTSPSKKAEISNYVRNSFSWEVIGKSTEMIFNLKVN
jgi:glycosyltransferase involved in cell wall biosynthesis